MTTGTTPGLDAAFAPLLRKCRNSREGRSPPAERRGEAAGLGCVAHECSGDAIAPRLDNPSPQSDVKNSEGRFRERQRLWLHLEPALFGRAG